MTGVNRMTIVAASEVVCNWKSHSELDVIATQWNLVDKFDGGSKPARVSKLAQLAITSNPDVLTEASRMPLDRALIELSIKAPPKYRADATWVKLIAGLKMDGYEIISDEPQDAFTWLSESTLYGKLTLKRMLPEDMPELDFREAEDEIRSLLKKHNIEVALGHLNQALSNFSIGQWASANGQIRSFVEDSFDSIAGQFGYSGSSGKGSRNYLGKDVEPPFLLNSVREWGQDNKAYYVQALMNRLSMEGNHPGLSDEENCTFNMQVALITMRLFLRRFDARIEEQ